MVRPHRKSLPEQLAQLNIIQKTKPPQKHCGKAQRGVFVWATKYMWICIFSYAFLINIITVSSNWRSIIKSKLVMFFVWFYVHEHKTFIYLKRCWRWIQKPDSQTDSSQIGASTPDSTFSWTANEKEEEGERKYCQFPLRGKPGENYGAWVHGKYCTLPSVAQDYYLIAAYNQLRGSWGGACFPLQRP